MKRKKKMPTSPNPPATRHLTREMDLPASLGPCAKWGERERRIATAVIEAHLLEPNDELRRRLNQHILLAVEIEDIEPLNDTQMAERLRAPDLRTRLSLELPSLAKRSADTLKRALEFDADKATRGRKSKAKNAKGKRYGRATRDILTVGLIVLIMYSSVQAGAKGYTPDAVMKLIHEQGRTNAMFLRSNKEVKTAWRRYRSVAHLAAALLQYLDDHDLTRFRREQRTEWRSNIVEFLKNAAFYQNFLTNTLPAVRPRRLRSEFDLIQLPTWLEVTPSKPAPLKEIAKFVQRGSSAPGREKAD
jgi:hypothetical protein